MRVDFGLVWRDVCLCGDVMIVPKYASDTTLLRTAQRHNASYRHIEYQRAVEDRYDYDSEASSAPSLIDRSLRPGLTTRRAQSSSSRDSSSAEREASTSTDPYEDRLRRRVR